MSDPHIPILREAKAFAVGLLQKGVSLEVVSIPLSPKNIQVTQRHYSLWVMSRQIALEAAVKAALK